MAANVPRLTPDQQQAIIAINGRIGSERGGIVFLDAPGGTGKTFLLNLLLAFVRKEKDMAVASSGIEATLLAGGRTGRPSSCHWTWPDQTVPLAIFPRAQNLQANCLG
ncbi:hypothetical protein TNCV_247761 [Trichonephila clavipes]|nr:hypothetical protein TNCV_247761 [Trichonephila clavipes]